jgi:hypothetical protein
MAVRATTAAGRPALRSGKAGAKRARGSVRVRRKFDPRAPPFRAAEADSAKGTRLRHRFDTIGFGTLRSEEGGCSSAGRPGGGGDRASLRTRPTSIETTDEATRLARPVLSCLDHGDLVDAVRLG